MMLRRCSRWSWWPLLPPALAQDGPAVIADSTGDVPYAKAGGAEAKVDCPDGIMES